ncbi:Lysyl oxidase -like protein 3 [Halotydeus destructor]|nr:Lysyl oxidase -like protein 3 [Halotydeus destructor]
MQCPTVLRSSAKKRPKTAYREANLVRNVQSAHEGTVRLVGGRAKNEGNIEVYHVGRWGSVCDDEWDMAEGHVVCRMLGYLGGATGVTDNSQFGRGRKVDDLRSFPPPAKDGSKEGKKHYAKDTKVQDILEDKSELQVRLVDGRNLAEGRVEVKLDREWQLVCADGWSLFEATVICRQLGLKYAQHALQTSFFGTGHNLTVSLAGLKCRGSEQSIAQCKLQRGYPLECVGSVKDNVAGVICTEELPDLVPDEKEVESSAYLEDRQLMLLQCAAEENCLSSAAYEVDKSNYRWMYETRRLLRFTARIANVGTTDFRPLIPKAAWQWHSCHRHYHSMEVFAHFDILDSGGARVAEGHKASFCLEDNDCQDGVEPKFKCANYGDQGITVGCMDTYMHSIDCQWIDITDMKTGIYQLKISINPEFKVAELSFDNNAVLCSLYYNAVSARLWNCTLTRP